jgi:hypothetical protein
MKRVTNETMAEKLCEFRVSFAGSVSKGKSIELIHNSEGLSLVWFKGYDNQVLLQAPSKREMCNQMSAFLLGLAEGKKQATVTMTEDNAKAATLIHALTAYGSTDK